MSIEADFRALLAGHAPLANLVGTRVAQNAVPQGASYPLVVYTVAHQLEHGLDGTLLADQASIQVQCWAKTAADADGVADAVAAAVATASQAVGATVTERLGVFDEELGLDGTQLTVEWWG